MDNLNASPSSCPPAAHSSRLGITLQFPGGTLELDEAGLRSVLQKALSDLVISNPRQLAVKNEMRADSSSSSSSVVSRPALPVGYRADAQLSSSSSDIENRLPEPRMRRKACSKRSCGQATNVEAPPIGIFWDIENVQVPRGKCALRFVGAIRERLMVGYREAELMCVCDIHKETPRVIQELNDASVNIVHVPAIAKNAADDKLRQAMRRFVDLHQFGGGKVAETYPTTTSPKIVLISRDVNFAPDLSDFRHRRGFRVALIGDMPMPKALLVTAHEHYLFSDIVVDVPFRNPEPADDVRMTKVHVFGLPRDQRKEFLQQKLKLLTSNCGGRVDFIQGDFAVISFQKAQVALRACKRLNGTIVCGKAIVAEVRETGRPVLHSVAVNQQLALRSEAIPVHRPQVRSAPVAPSVPPEPNLIDADSLPDLSKPPPNYDLLTTEPSGQTVLPPPLCPVINVAESALSGPLVNLEPDDATTPTMNSTEPQNLSLSGTADEGSVLVRDEHDAVAVTGKAKVCTASGHADWLRSQLHLKTPPSPVENGSDSGNEASPAGGSVEATEEMPPSPCDGEVNSSGSVSGSELSSSSSGTVGNMEVVMHRHQRVSGGNFLRFSYPSPCRSNGVTQHPPPNNRFSNGYASPGHGLHRGSLASGVEAETERRVLTGTPGSRHSDDGSPVWIVISNLECGKDAHLVRQMLLTHLREFVEVLSCNMHQHAFGSYTASVKLKSVQDQQVVISNFHRKKLGNKRILISTQGSRENAPYEILTAQVAALLKDVPGGRLPLFKFRELFENRFNGGTVSLSDLNQMSDLVIVEDDLLGGRFVCLRSFGRENFQSSANRNHGAFQNRNGLSICNGDKATDGPSGDQNGDGNDGLLMPPAAFCFRHAPSHLSRNDGVGWAEKAASLPALPQVNISLKLLGPRVHSLLQTHDGILPLASLPICYEQQFGMSMQNGCTVGVHLEHLVTCIQGVKLVNVPGGSKHLKWQENSGDDAQVLNVLPIEDSKVASPTADSQNGPANADTLQNQLFLFSREVVDLLRIAPRSMLPFGKFIPAYHHHFGRQCRVSDYGFTKLIDLLNAIPHVVQVMGDGQRRVVTLTHAAQVRRFLSELLRIVKSQPNMQLALSDFAAQYQKLNFKTFDIFDYGVCSITDLLSDLSDSTVKVETTDDDTILSIPKREQTAAEIARTRQFAVEVLELLKNLPRCRMSFDKFIPAYHHLFGKQCRVANYGFTKLMELFEAIPDVIEVSEEQEDCMLSPGAGKTIRLIETERLKVLEEQILSLADATKGKGVPLGDVGQIFAVNYGYTLDPAEYGATSVEEVIASLRRIKIVESRDGPIVLPVTRGALHFMALRVRRVLLDEPDGKMDISSFIKEYKDRFDVPCSMEIIRRDLFDIVEVDGDNQTGSVRLTPLQVFGRDVQNLLNDHGGRMLVANFERAYAKKFGTPCNPSVHGYASLNSLLHAIPEYVFFKGRAQVRLICVSRELTSPSRRVSGDSEGSNGRRKNQNGSVNGNQYQKQASAENGRRNGYNHNHRSDFSQTRFAQRKLNFMHGVSSAFMAQSFRNNYVEQSYVNTEVVTGLKRGSGNDFGHGHSMCNDPAPTCPAPVAAPDPKELPDPAKLWARA